MAVAVIGCDGPRADPAPAPPVTAAPARRAVHLVFVDSVRYANEIGTYDAYLRRVAVRSEGRVDTIPGVVTDAMPVVVGDTAVIGLRSDQDRTVGLFRYDVRRRRVELPR